MFGIKLVDIGGDGLVVDCQTAVDTLAETEILVKAAINQRLGIHCTELTHIEDLGYAVLVNGHDAGFVEIRSL